MFDQKSHSSHIFDKRTDPMFLSFGLFVPRTPVPYFTTRGVTIKTTQQPVRSVVEVS